MNYPLAIFAPYIGACSETFIRRHMQNLLPEGTVVVTGTVDGPHAGYWSVDCPVLVLDRIQASGLKQQLVRAVARRFGWRPADYLASAVTRFLKRHHVQVVMGEYLDLFLPWLGAVQELGVRLFGHAHGYDVSERLCDPKWRAACLAYNQANGVITMSQVSRERLIGLGLEASKVYVIPYGVDVPPLPLPRLQQKAVRCIAVGRMVAKKAPILTLDAFRRAAKVCPNLQLDYVGAGELLPAAHQFVRTFKLGDSVRLHGPQPNEVVRRLMREADICLQHSVTDPVTGDEEGLPVTLLEAMALSLPVVSTRHAGIPEAVLDGFTGYLVEEGDSHGMADRLITLTCDPGLRRRMGEAGWHRAKEHFSWEKERADLLRVLGLV